MTSTEKINLIYKVTDKEIFGFFKEHRFLSNFHVCPILYDGIEYQSTEAAYQAAKTDDLQEKHWISTLDPFQAKKYGQKVKIIEEWEYIKFSVMRNLSTIKFNTHKYLGDALLNTGYRHLEETNYWGDVYWGTNEKHEGFNALGKILMITREHIGHRYKLMVNIDKLKEEYHSEK